MDFFYGNLYNMLSVYSTAILYLIMQSCAIYTENKLNFLLLLFFLSDILWRKSTYIWNNINILKFNKTRIE